MILALRKVCAASSIISKLSLDSAIFSLSCLMPVPPPLAGPFLSMTLSQYLFAASPSGSAARSSLMTSNSPLKRGSLAMSIWYLSILSSSWLTPGTVWTTPSYDPASWNSLKRQAATQPVVERDRPTWQLTMTGVLTAVPWRAPQRVSKSASSGDAELQTGILLWVSLGNFSFSFSITSWRVVSSFTSTSSSFLETSTYLSLPPFDSTRPVTTFKNSVSSALRPSLVTFPSSAYSPILFGGRAHMGLPLT